MIYDESLVMPFSYATLSENEMEYLEGGKAINLSMSRSYLSRNACTEKARWLITYGYCNNMDVSDIAKEIFGHACAAYYADAAKLALPRLSSTIEEIASHAMDGIFLDDGKDSAARVAMYNACWYIPLLGEE